MEKQITCPGHSVTQLFRSVEAYAYEHIIVD